MFKKTLFLIMFVAAVYYFCQYTKTGSKWFGSGIKYIHQTVKSMGIGREMDPSSRRLMEEADHALEK